MFEADMERPTVDALMLQTAYSELREFGGGVELS